MAAIQDDFAAYTTIGERVAPPVEQKSRKPQGTGPAFGVNSKLEPFVLLAKSARGSGAAALVSQAVGAAGVFVFSELLEQSSIKDSVEQLEKSDNEQHRAQYRLLELFAYGTWGDYVGASMLAAKRDSFPTLTAEQETKLKQLTILTLATQSRSIPYATLLSTLSLPDVPALEDLLISAFYSGVLSGRLDQKASLLEVLSAHGRDVRPSPVAASESMDLDASAPSASSAIAPSVADLTASLTAFATRLSTLLSSLDTHINTLRTAQLNAVQSQLLHEERVKATIEEVQKSDKSGSGKGGWKGALGDAASRATSALAQGAANLAGVASGGGAEGMDVDLPAPPAAGGSRGAPPPAPPGGAGSGDRTAGAGGAGRARKRGRI
ncbi:hypothetical protein JCM10213v2_006731 [Rhodosporidiobolus nylandii]